jgi:hypothetical protein
MGTFDVENGQMKYNQIDLEVLNEMPYPVSFAFDIHPDGEWLWKRCHSYSPLANSFNRAFGCRGQSQFNGCLTGLRRNG